MSPRLRSASDTAGCNAGGAAARASRSSTLRRLKDLGLGDVDAEPLKADIVALARGDQVDRGDAEILEDLGAEADLAPFVLAAASLFVILAVAAHWALALLMRDADRAFAQIDDDTAPALAHRL